MNPFTALVDINPNPAAFESHDDNNDLRKRHMAQNVSMDEFEALERNFEIDTPKKAVS
jgi:hypothetical protein